MAEPLLPLLHFASTAAVIAISEEVAKHMQRQNLQIVRSEQTEGRKILHQTFLS